MTTSNIHRQLQHEYVAVNPFEWFMNDAILVKERLDKCQDREGCRRSIMLLGEILRCYSKLLTGVYVSIYLLEDYPFEKNDRYVFEFFLNRYLSHNEMIGLCDLLKRFLKERCSAYRNLPYLFQNNFDELRLLSPPMTVKGTTRHLDKLKKYGEHVFAVINTFHNQRQIAGLEKDFHVGWNHDAFQEKQEYLNLFENMRYSRKQPGICSMPVRFSGQCYVWNRQHDYILDLSPVVIALRDEDLRESLAVISNYRGDAGDIIGRFESHGLLKYRELTGTGKSVFTYDERLFSGMYHKIGSLLEEPEFKKHFDLVENRDFQIDLFNGDMFDLNFLQKGVNRKGLVNVTYTSPYFHTPISMRLEMLSGEKLEDVLGAGGQKKIARGDIFPGKGGKLNFDAIFHCPVYNVKIKQRKDPFLNYIDTTINNLIEQCAKKNIDVLVVPAIGSYWGEQERYKVARMWCRNIRGIGLDNPLRRIIFAFINELALDVYNQTIEQESSIRIKSLHWPIREIVDEINRSLISRDFHARFENCLKLTEYIHYFLVAWALKSMMAERGEKSCGNMKSKTKFLTIFMDRHKYKTQKDADRSTDKKDKTSERKSDPLGIGGWRYLCSLANSATKDNAWHYDTFFNGRKRLQEKFHSIIGGGPGSDELINLRNRFQGHNLSLKAQESTSETFMKISNQAYEIICSYLDAMPFLKNTNLALVLVEKFEIIDMDRDECAVSFYEITNDTVTSRMETIKLELSQLNGRFFESGKIYLFNRNFEPGKSSRPLALNMHPFLLQGQCRDCSNETIFTWNNFHRDDTGHFSLDYGCIACGALKSDIISETGRIGKFSKSELDKKFNEILNTLFKKE